MKSIVLRKEERGKANHGWLNAAHSFSFASYYNPKFINFGLLRVFNDDVVAPGMGFGTHPHDNMEIVTIILNGALEHKDSMGSNSIITKGEVQIMSAGKGITHSEFNPNKEQEVNLLQIWVFPKLKNIEPRYAQAMFSLEDRMNKIITVVSPNHEHSTLWINQETWFSLGASDSGLTQQYFSNKAGNGIWIFVIEGKLDVNGIILEKRDSAGIVEIDNLNIKVNEKAEFLIIEVPMA